MLPLVLLPILLLCWVSASTLAQTGGHADTSSITDLDGAVRQVLSPVPRQSREAVDWLVQHGDHSSLAILIQLLRWLPEYQDLLVARLEALTGARVGKHWFD